MKKFELWLDESGDFKEDAKNKKKGLNPSHIGGILVEKSAFNDTAIEKIIPEKFSHGTEEDKNVTFEKFRKIEEKANDIREKQKFFRYVVFSNKECIMVLDNNITYQNIMAEGITQLIVELKSLFNEAVHLDILIARRFYTTASSEEQKSVEQEEYEYKIKEKIIMSGLHNNISENEWSIKIASARREKKLMLADNVCNCFLTKTTKFKGEQSEYITKIYNNGKKTLKYSVLQASIEKQFRELMAERRLGEAITVLCQCEDIAIINKCMEIVSQRISELDGKEIELQYNFIASLTKFYIDIIHSYEQAERMLKNILQFFIPILENRGKEELQLAKKMTFDLNFYLFTLYSHRGNVDEAMEIERTCDKAFEALPAGWDIIELGIKYEIRKASNQNNNFNFENALKLNDNVIAKCREIKELLEMYREDVKYDELAKALGTQVQIYTFLLRFHSEYYEEAVKASDEALEEFVSLNDITRQQIYRIHLEIEGNHFDEAYNYLCLACKLAKGSSVNKFREMLLNANRNLFEVYAYVNLMTEGKVSNWNKADELYFILQKTNAMQEIMRIEEKNHPIELILWKYARYLVKNGENKAGFEAYKSAIEACFRVEDMTINVIGLAVELERYAVSLENEMKEKAQYKKSLQKKYQNLYSKNLPDSIQKLFQDINFGEEDWKYYYNLSRQVTY